MRRTVRGTLEWMCGLSWRQEAHNLYAEDLFDLACQETFGRADARLLHSSVGINIFSLSSCQSLDGTLWNEHLTLVNAELVLKSDLLLQTPNRGRPHAQQRCEQMNSSSSTSRVA